MKRLLLLSLLLPLVGCSWAGTKVEGYLDRRAEKKVEKAAEMVAERPVKLAPELARDVTLFTGTVTGPCRGLEVRPEGAGQLALDPPVEELTDILARVAGARDLAEAEEFAGQGQRLVPELRKARGFGGIHGGCLLPVTVAGDPAGPDGTVAPRKVLCPLGPIETSCKALPTLSVVNFVGGIVGADRVYYVPSGPIKGGG